MAESEKKGSSSTDLKEKRSMLDDDIGKEFLSSWKSMSVAENDTMDFGFDTIPSGKKSSAKKNAFDFGKLGDMDFSLDNDFGKFNVDMSDLDLSSSPKKVAKPKDQREGESSSKNNKGKDGPFNFSFDFNELDDFNLDSALKKQQNAPKDNLDRNIVASDKSDLRDSSIDLDVNGRVAAFDEGKNNKVLASGSVLNSDKSELRDSSIDLEIDGRVAAFDEGQNKKVSASGSVLNSDVETAPKCAENRDVLIEKLPSKSRKFGDMVVLHTESSSPGRISTVNVDKEDQQVLFSTKARPAVSSAKERSQISLGQSLGRDDSPKDNVSDVQMEIDCLGSKLHPESVLQHSGNDGMLTDVGCDHETSELKNSDSPYVKREEHKQAESDTVSKMPKENPLGSESVAHGLEIEAIPASILSPSISKDCTDNNDAKDFTAKVLAPLVSEQVVEKVKLIKEGKAEVVRSKFFRRSEEPEPQVCQPLPVNEKASVLESQGTAALTLNSLENGKSKELNKGESQIGRNSFGDSKSLSRDSDKGESALVGREKNVKNLSNIRVGLNETGVVGANKLPDKSWLLEKEPNKVTSDMLGSTKFTKDLSNFRTTKPSCQTSENSKKLVPNTGSKTFSVSGSIVKKTDISSFKLLRTSVSSEAQTDASQEFNSLKNSQKSVKQKSMLLPGKFVSSKAQADVSHEFSSLKSSQKSVELPVKFVSSKAQTGASQEISSLKNSQISVELPLKLVSNAAHPISKTRSNLPGMTSLKRKTLEGPTREAVPLNPHKRLSESPRESRNSNEPIKSVVDKQNNTNIVDGSGTTSEEEMPMDVNVKELEISLTMENDGNAEKAEVYAKELENICNMLKKKHEEAKEIMVRAIVNNNGLLILNHPIFDEKIRNVQELLKKLTMSD